MEAVYSHAYYRSAYNPAGRPAQDALQRWREENPTDAEMSQYEILARWGMDDESSLDG
jgi:hypothetical protein